MDADRDAAIDRLRDALDGFYISGVQHNVAFLAAVVGKPRFRAGTLSTNFIAEEFPGGFTSPADFVEPDRMILLAAALAGRRIRERETEIDGKLTGVSSEIPEQWTILLDGAPHSVRVRSEDSGYAVEIDGERLTRGYRLAAGPSLAACAYRGAGRDRADRTVAGRGVSSRPWRRHSPRPGAVAARRRSYWR